MRIRPYVAEPDGEPGETTVRPLMAVEPEEDGGGPATTDLGLFPSMYSGVEYAPEEPPVLEPVVVRGRHRRRRRSIVVAAAAVAASALAAGAVAVSGQVMGDEQGATDRALPDLNASMPDVQLPHVAARVSESAAPPAGHVGTPTTTAATPRATPSASRPVSTPTGASDGASPQPTASAGATPVTPTTDTTPTAPSTTAPASTPDTPRSEPLQPSDTSATLRLGDSGQAVTDLQRDLHAAHVYYGRYDGIFDRDVEMAVTTFQLWHHVSDSPLGTYGPNTRAALTQSLTSTSAAPHHHR
ncbi:Putative peptidoglycan binding domain-containing protein [Streptomyces sp. DvalAA-14]|uniref:peptidoglycan-binding domain-containing protein n=1 Tax=unclassified Streptomyces TaxID=2593676 RepID=UPI00081B1159|nr:MULTISPECIES: peptidoglycan-binding domain-containing protein [unclassified Streptomyces]MYS23268.1 hypothetical protein [Streptomyces sp. SID4948]SCE30449.1 Putative peptidoglycan binding domain-containing protein [Streptomyces sp. DvalAA-14]